MRTRLLVPILAAAVSIIAVSVYRFHFPERREAALAVFSNCCGNSWESAYFRAQVKVVRDAGASLIPMLTELVADPTTSSWFVGSACRFVAQYPLSVEFRDAVRRRRDSFRPPTWMSGIFEYFEKFGDNSDLRWMESYVRSVSESQTDADPKSIERLRARLVAR